LKQAPPLKGSAKVEEKELHLRFEPMDGGKFKIIGKGENKFGHFHLNGTLSETGAVHIYREYFKFNPVQIPTVGSSSTKNRPKLERRPSISTVEVETPREASQRVRRQSSQMRDFQDLQSPRSYEALSTLDNSVTSSSGAPLQRQASYNTERSQRLPPAFRRCLELLKEFMKLPQSRWFLEPVDPVKLNIPDYPKIIKTPMDFGTIRMNLENNVYESLDQFAEDMRLVFRNAVTFNTMRENIVNIAARELSAKFEEKFRQLLASVNTVNYAIPAEPKMFRASSNGFGAKKKKVSNGTPRFSGPGPRASFPFVPPAAVDGNMMQVIELQRQMAIMQEELNRLRSLLTEKEIAESLRESKEAAQNPLTFEEKKQLVAMVAKLPEDRMHQLVQIIRDGLPDDRKNDEINEVPLDILDTLTLRKLQRFVQIHSVSDKKKRSAPPSAERSRSESNVKRVKRESVGIADLNTTEFVPSNDHGDIDLFDHDELLTEKFEDHDGTAHAIETEKFEDFEEPANEAVDVKNGIQSMDTDVVQDQSNYANNVLGDDTQSVQSHGKEITQEMLNESVASIDRDEGDDGWAALESVDT